MPAAKRIDDGIPKAFSLAGHKIEVVNIPSSKWKNGKNCVGMWLPDKYRIELHGSLKGTNRQQIFLHEAVHAIMDVAGYYELSGDEAFVDRVSHFLHHMLVSME
ncbi:hypothetical protein EBT31_00335 [bacterium]|nr:hypothetical protein [bacterium]